MIKSFFKINKINLLVHLFLCLFIILILLILTFSSIILSSWIYGYLLALMFGLISFILHRFSFYRFLKEENPFEFVFYSILKTGIYSIPFLISVYLLNVFNIFGITIGTIQFVLLNTFKFPIKAII